MPDFKTYRLPSSQNGFTLIETMVAIAIFVIAIIGCYQLQTSSSFSNSRSNAVATASTWAQYMAEDLLAREYKDDNGSFTDPLLLNSKGNADGWLDRDSVSPAIADGVRYIGADGSVNTVAAAGDLYSIFWNIIDNRPMNNVKQIRILVVKNGGFNSGIRLYTQDYYKLGPLL